MRDPRLVLPYCLCLLTPCLAVAQAPVPPQPASLKDATGPGPDSPAAGAGGVQQMKATIKRAPDGTILAFEIGTEGKPGAERAKIDYKGPESRTIDYGDGQGGTVQESFYNVGLRKDVTTSDGDRRVFTYEQMQPKTETHVGGVWQGWELTWDSNERGIPTTTNFSGPGLTSPVQMILTFDKYARPENISGPRNFTGTYHYTEGTGKLESFHRGVLNTTWAYDSFGRLSDVKTTTDGSVAVYRYHYDYDRRNMRTERLAEGAGKSWKGMEHDDIGRLVRAVGYTYAFDSQGRGLPGKPSAASPGKFDFVSEFPGFDGAGRPTGDALWEYQWDQRGLLVGLNRRAGKARDPRVIEETLRYEYDANRRRVRKVWTLKFNPSMKRPDFVEESRMLWDGSLPAMEERKRAGVALPRRWFVWGRDLGAHRESAGGIGGLVAIIEEGKRTLLPVDDGAGNIMAVVDGATGKAVAKYNYGPMGEVEPVDGDVDACPFRYQTRHFDSDSELYYGQGLFYLPRMGRWLGRIVLGKIELNPLLEAE